MSSPTFQPPSLEQLASLLPAYDFEEFIAQGGMGAVYRARQRSLDRVCAIKILPPELGSDAEFRESFQAEARAMARLNHPNLIGVYDSGSVGGMPYIVMELVEGESLYHATYGVKVDAEQVVTIIRGICAGLQNAHENGIIHRDIKPANILLTQKLEPKIGDFGLARPAGSSQGLVMGTPEYTAPEVLQYPDHADRRSDIFAVGVILYELLTGQKSDPNAPIPPSQLSGCGTGLDQIWRKATAPNAALRYSSAGELIAALDEWKKPPAPLGGPKQNPAAGGRMIKPRIPHGAKRVVVKKKSSSLPQKLAIVVVIAALAGGGYYQWDKIQKQNAETEKQRIAEIARKEAEAKAKKEQAERDAQAAAEAERLRNRPKTLEQLKEALASGDRTHMPEGSEAFDQSYIMMIPQPMNWQDAVFFAQNYGAHLYVPKSDEDLEKISTKLAALGEPYAAGVWLGAAKAGRNTWGTVIGKPWSLNKKPIGVAPFVAVDGDNILRTKKHDDRQPFIIQWDLDGKNPGSFFEMLRRTAASVKGNGQPDYPPGCMVYDGKPVLLIAHRSTLAEAKAFSKSFGGHLVALADKDKNTWLIDQLKDFSPDAAYWLGAERKGSGWKWPNGDKWAAEGWAPGEPSGDGSCVIIRPGGGWQATHGNQQASGFIMEWSPLPEQDSGPKDETIYVDLKGKAQQILKEMNTKREAQLKENTTTLEGDLDKWQKGLKKNEETLWAPEIRAMKGLIKDSRISNRKPEDEGIRIGGGMKKAYEIAKARQEEIDADFASKAITIQKSYIKHLQEQKAQFEKDGDTQKVASVQTELEDSEDVDDWINKMGFISGAEDE